MPSPLLFFPGHQNLPRSGKLRSSPPFPEASVAINGLLRSCFFWLMILVRGRTLPPCVLSLRLRTFPPFFFFFDLGLLDHLFGRCDGALFFRSSCAGRSFFFTEAFTTFSSPSQNAAILPSALGRKRRPPSSSHDFIIHKGYFHFPSGVKQKVRFFLPSPSAAPLRIDINPFFFSFFLRPPNMKRDVFSFHSPLKRLVEIYLGTSRSEICLVFWKMMLSPP